MLSFADSIRALVLIDCSFDAVRVAEQYLKMQFTKRSLAFVEKLLNFHEIFKNENDSSITTGCYCSDPPRYGPVHVFFCTYSIVEF